MRLPWSVAWQHPELYSGRLCYAPMMGKKDIVSKEAIKRIAVDLATILLDLNIDPETLELLETEKQRF